MIPLGNYDLGDLKNPWIADCKRSTKSPIVTLYLFPFTLYIIHIYYFLHLSVSISLLYFIFIYIIGYEDLISKKLAITFVCSSCPTPRNTFWSVAIQVYPSVSILQDTNQSLSLIHKAYELYLESSCLVFCKYLEFSCLVFCIYLESSCLVFCIYLASICLVFCIYLESSSLVFCIYEV